MKRTPLKRKTSLKGGKPLARVSEKQKAKLEAWAEIKREKLRVQVLERGFNYCNACGRRTDHLDLDHIKPAGKGGAWSSENSQLLCRPCHSKKHRNVPEWSDRPVEEVVLKEGLL